MVFAKRLVRECFKCFRINGVAAGDAITEAVVFDAVQGCMNAANFALCHIVQIIEDIQIAQLAAFAIKRFITGLCEAIFNVLEFPVRYARRSIRVF